MLATSFRRLALVSLLCLAALVVWASWEEPNLHDYAKPVQVALLRVEGIRSPAQAQALEQQLGAVPGVAACTFNARTQVATLLYHAAEVSEAELTRIVSVGGTLPVQPLAVAAAPASARQCPVPPGYLLALERVRFALNLRRLFVRV